MYSADNASWLPSIHDGTYSWADMIRPYLGLGSIKAADRPSVTKETVLKCPSEVTKDWLHYGVNMNLQGTSGRCGFYGKIIKGTTFTYLDSNALGQNAWVLDALNGMFGPSTYYYNKIQWRHGSDNSCNVLFYDGHVTKQERFKDANANYTTDTYKVNFFAFK
jgi:prepilin-type processing-associated H-X9-DG protein